MSDPEHDPTHDVDPQETQEWLEALDSALQREGPLRAHYLIERLIDLSLIHI